VSCCMTWRGFATKKSRACSRRAGHVEIAAHHARMALEALGTMNDHG